jgi:Flp pilus assembly protein CpaB
MRRGRLLIVLAIILLAGVAAVFIFTRLIGTDSGAADQGEAPIYTANIVFSAQDIARGAIIPADGVIISPFPSDYVVETMVMDVNDVIGKRARMDIPRGSPITSNMFTTEPGDLSSIGSDAAMSIQPGYTAIAIPTTRLSSVAYALRPGDAVDVLATMLIVDLDAEFQSILPNLAGSLVSGDSLLSSGPSTTFTYSQFEGVTIAGGPDPVQLGRVETDDLGELIYAQASESQRPRLVTQRVVEQATVLRLGSFQLESEIRPAVLPEDEDQPAPTTSENLAPDVITLVVSHQDALVLNWAVKANVDLTLTLRSPDDFTEYETSSVTLQYLIDNYNIAIPAKLPYGLEPRQDTIPAPNLPNDRFSVAPVQ